MAKTLSSRLPWILVAGALFVGLPWFATFYTDWLWFGETGYQQIFIRQTVMQAIMALVTGVVVFGLLTGNWWLALRALSQPYLILGPATVDVRPIVLQRRQLRLLMAGAGLLVATVVAMVTASEWLAWLLAWRGGSFGQVDPILGYDVGFYIFRFPVLDRVHGLLEGLLLVALVGAAAVYVLSGAVRLDPRRAISLSPRARMHLALLVGAFFLVLAFGAWLNVPRLLISSSGIVHGASYVDVNVRVTMLRVLMGVSILGAVLAVVHALSERTWPLLTAVALYLLVWIGGGAVASGVQRITVTPNELARETPYIVHHVAATRRAFALDRVEERELSGDVVLTRADIDRNADTLRNVPLWDHQPLLDTFGQIQEIRTYYDFVSVDNDRYEIGGQKRQVMLSARELSTESLPNRSWINERLVFTHGYGVALGPVNQVTPEGLPVLFIKNLPPESSIELKLEEPSIYFGEKSSDHVFVRTRAREFHYPKGEDNVYATYAGQGGVPVDSVFRKLLFSLRFRSWKVFLSDDIGPESRVLFHRRIAERVDTIAPFLTYDSDPYLVLADGRLFWIWDAYTTSRRYPYSAPTAMGINYIRNSVKVVVDAYHGTTTYYLADDRDPIAVALGEAFPGFLKPIGTMPETLRRHLRYPEDIFGLQTAVYSTFHMTNPEVFYNKEDQWEVPAIDQGNQPVPMRPYYTMMRLPGEGSAEFIQMLPFTPRRKDNLAAWMVARSDGDHYGKMLVFRFPKQKVVFGPRQIVGRINQDQAISPQITLWNQQGSQVLQGTLLVIPIEESLLYIRPLYLRAEGGAIPELKRVIVANENQIVMEDTLEAAIDSLFGGAGRRPSAGVEIDRAAAPPAPGGAAGAPPGTPPTQEERRAADSLDTLAAQASEHYDRALRAQREGDWATYGAEIKKVGEILDRLARGRR